MINESSTALHTKIFMQFLSFWDSVSQKSVENFEIIHKTYSVLVWGAVSPLYKCELEMWSDRLMLGFQTLSLLTLD